MTWTPSERFSRFYNNKHQGRKLSWLWHLSKGEIKANSFKVMGLSPLLGRVTNEHDDGPAAAPVSVLTHEFWMEHFGGDPKVIGSGITLDGVARLAPARIVVSPGPCTPNEAGISVPLIRRFADIKPGFGDNRLHLPRAAARKCDRLEGPNMPCALASDDREASRAG